MPLISVIVPIYKVEPYIQECVESILSQTFTDWELVLVNDGSPDNCPTICDEFARRDKRIHVIHKDNGGLASARNAGLDYALFHSTSKYIAFIDADDVVSVFFLEVLLQTINGGDLAICGYLEFLDGEEFLKAVPNTEKKRVSYEPKESFKGIDIIVCNKLYAKELWHGLRFPLVKRHEDEFIAHRILGKCKTIYYIDQCLYFYRQRPHSIMHSLSDDGSDEMLLLQVFYDRINYYLFERVNLTSALLDLRKSIRVMIFIFSRFYSEQKNTLLYYFRSIKKLRKSSCLKNLKISFGEVFFLSFPRTYCQLKRRKIGQRWNS